MKTNSVLYFAYLIICFMIISKSLKITKTNKTLLNKSQTKIHSKSLLKSASSVSIQMKHNDDDDDKPSFHDDKDDDFNDCDDNDRNKPKQGCIWLYENCGFSGPKLSICSDTKSVSIGSKVSSVRVGSYTYATLFSQVNYGGVSFVVSDDVTCFTSNSAPAVLKTSLENHTYSVKLDCHPPAPVPQKPKQGCVWLFNGCNFTGTRVEFCSDYPDFRNTPYLFNDLASSLQVGPNTQLTLFLHVNYQGTHFLFDDDEPCLTTNTDSALKAFDNNASSLKILSEFSNTGRPVPGCVWLFQNCDFSGYYVELCENNPDFKALYSSFDNLASGIKVGSNTQAVLYIDANYGGAATTFIEDVQCFDSVNKYKPIANQSSSIKISLKTPREGCVYIYNQCDFNGVPVEFCSDNADFRNAPYNFNDLASGVRLGPNTQAILYLDINFGGIAYNFEEDVACFKTSPAPLSAFDNQASSIQIVSKFSNDGKSPREGCVWLFNDCNFASTPVEFCSNNHDFRSSPWNFNDLASGIKLGKDTKAVLYHDVDYSGTAIEFVQDTICFATNTDPIVKAFDNVASSVKILPNLPKSGCVWLYNGCGYEGVKWEFCANEPDFRNPPYLFNDFASSIKVGADTKATLYQDVQYSGQSFTFSSSNSCFSDDSNDVVVKFLNNKGSSIKITNQPPQNCAWLYSDCNYEGTKKEFCTNNDNFTLQPINFNDLASSIKVGDGTQAKVFEHILYQGRQLVFKSNNSCFKTNTDTSIQAFDKLISSIQLGPIVPEPTAPAQGCVWLYQNCGYDGIKKEFCANNDNFVTLSFNDIASAIRVGPNTQATVFEHINYQGRTLTTANDLTCFINNDFNDIASSIQVGPKVTPPTAPASGCVWLYQDCQYQGTKVEYCVDDPDFRTENFNDLGSAIVLGPNTQATLFEHINYQGRQLSFTENKACFYNDPDDLTRAFNDLSSSIKITKGKRPCVRKSVF